MREDMAPLPEDPYGISKYAVELDLAAAQHMFGLDYTVFRPHNVYGERQNIADRYRNVIGIFMNNVMQGQPMPVFGDGLQTRAFSHIADVAPIIARAPSSTAPATRYSTSGPTSRTRSWSWARESPRRSTWSPSSSHLDARNEVVHAFSDHSKIQHVFDHDDTISLTDGIDRMADWARAHGPRPQVEFVGEIELDVNLPPSWRARIS